MALSDLVNNPNFIQRYLSQGSANDTVNEMNNIIRNIIAQLGGYYPLTSIQ